MERNLGLPAPPHAKTRKQQLYSHVSPLLAKLPPADNSRVRALDAGLETGCVADDA